ncbi:TlyA family RNA methyltransferase [Alicyclobacillus sp. SO9]|uniref:TlyA family RNA methyltransferase n=1 Tax=Alicyclobacillus sp. SO9 TaxID=2665646 RepID=UPI0018E86326|nr:TlyA family RNA methyltransferase [Alicyclobacillus sp. SO9]QQE76965.1 TlyA family RNA methyltransferase [Alicyclobacillus sp. SO9]
MKKVRLDLLVAEAGGFASREAAKRAIMAGLVKNSKGEVLDKPGQSVPESLQVQITGPAHQFVGRGGLKLERALKQFGVSLDNKVVLDVGASTGGFTDCSLQHGAALVYAVDVGYGQLAWKLRNDSRVVVRERTNFRHVAADEFDPRPEVAVMDVSFISTRLLIPKLLEVLSEPKQIISLVKPQFEAGKGSVGKGGIVRDPGIHVEVLQDLLKYAYSEGLECGGIEYSPISGGDGNIEYLALWRMNGKHETYLDVEMWGQRVREVVIEAWQTLQSKSVEEIVIRSHYNSES